MTQHNPGGSGSQLKIKEKLRRWAEEEKEEGAKSDNSLSEFDRSAHKVQPYEFVFLKKPSVREVFSSLHEEFIRTEQAFLARTVGEITEDVDFGQSTVTKAIQELEEAPIITRMSHASTRDHVIGLVGPIASHLAKSMEEFQRTARLRSPPANSRAEGIIGAYERHVSDDNPWTAHNNIEIWYRGELMGLAPNTDLTVHALRNARGLLDVTVRPSEGEVPSKAWTLVKKHSKALTQGFASVSGYNPDTGEYPSVIAAAERVVTPGGCTCKSSQCVHWIVDAMDTSH